MSLHLCDIVIYVRSVAAHTYIVLCTYVCMYVCICVVECMYFRLIFVSHVDINECANPSTHNCSQECRNTIGSYECACPRGYQLGEDGFSCKGTYFVFVVF